MKKDREKRKKRTKRNEAYAMKYHAFGARISRQASQAHKACPMLATLVWTFLMYLWHYCQRIRQTRELTAKLPSHPKQSIFLFVLAIAP
jgi:hypothetical protein